jgi:glycosyltransferase involved in cell wall biosynthesis
MSEVLPEVSVLMTVYNGMPYVEEAIQSIEQQSLANWELIVVDDGSTDATPAFLYALADPRIRIVHQPNGGPPVAANRGLQLCRAEFTARMDADDVAHPSRLQRQRDFLRAHPAVGLLGTQVAPLGKRPGRSLHLPQDHAAIFEALMQGRHGLCHSSIMCRTQLLKEIGGYWERGIAEDWDMFLRMGERAELANLDEVLLHYRILACSLQGSRMAELRQRIAYSCDRARRRQQGLPPIDYSDFQLQRQRAPVWSRLGDVLDGYALSHYRLAMGEILGAQIVRGYARLAWAACLSPRLTQQRLRRMLGKQT